MFVVRRCKMLLRPIMYYFNGKHANDFYTPTEMNKHLAKALKKINITTHITSSIARLNYASYGVHKSTEATQLALGHKRKETTLNYYVVIPDDMLNSLLVQNEMNDIF